MNKNIYKNFIPIFFIFNLVLFSQTKTNLEIVDSLIFSSISDISRKIDIDEKENVYLKFIAADDYQILKNIVISSLQKNKVNLVEDASMTDITLNYNLIEIKTSYPEMFRDGLFGEYLAERNVSLNGSYFLVNEKSIGKVNSFNYSIEDTVVYDDINQLENIAYSFTSAELPEEPFFSSTLEPVIAIGTAAVAAYLFFNVRSK